MTASKNLSQERTSGSSKPVITPDDKRSSGSETGRPRRCTDLSHGYIRTVRIATWNVNSLRSRIDRVEAFLERHDIETFFLLLL